MCDVLHKKTVFLKLQILQSLIKKELNSEPVYNDKYIKTKITLTPPPPTLSVLSVVLFLWLNGWLHHIWFAIFLNDNMDLHMTNLGTLVSEWPWCVFYAIGTLVSEGPW